jgi:ribose transport system ATP-binding protein
VASGSIGDVSNAAIIAQMLGRPAAGLFPVRPRTPGAEVVMSVRGLASPPKLREASFDLRCGEILGIGGLIGSGRTELVRALFGLDRLTAGTVELTGQGRPGKRVSAAARVRAGVGFLSEDRKGEGLALPLPVADNVCATRPTVRSRWPGVLDLARQAARTRLWMRALHIRATSPMQQVRALSGGNQQKVALARLLQQDATVWLLDEPTRGVDIGSKAEVYEVIAKQAAAGCAVLIVSSYLPELFGLCDRLAVMCRGRLTEARPIEEWTPELVLATATGAETS